MKLKQLLYQGKKTLEQFEIDDSTLKSRAILSYVLQIPKEQILINELEEVLYEKQVEYENCIKKIAEGVPLQYITHNQEFMGLDFYVDENVLIPQPDTEILVEETLKVIHKFEQSNEDIQVLDLCTGSGAIAISIAYYCKENQMLKQVNQNTQWNSVEILATDISAKALEIAKKNAKINKVQEQVKFIQSNLFEELSNNQFDIIVSNPPYIQTSIILKLSKEVRQEPILALDGGMDGLDFYKAILRQASSYLKPHGYLLLEIGYDQGKAIIDLLENQKLQEGNKLELITKSAIKDLGGNERVLILKKK